MVGVPRSQGCMQCIRRRIKCDQARPQCRRCLIQGSACPGYNRRLKFQDQTRSLMQKYGQPSIDEVLAPNLALEAINTQSKQCFETWLDDHFPSYMHSFNLRVDVNWMHFIQGRWSTFPGALIWAIRALISLHMGAVHRNREAIMCARHMYGQGIRHLACLLHTSAALSDETLTAAVLLGGYEILDGSSDRSWMIHSRGIRHLFCARGPSAHLRGMGRTLMLSWRPYIVADAFIHSVPCFLGEPEWTRICMSEEVASAEEQQQQGSLLGQTMDYAFNEVARCPGYLAATRDIITANMRSDSAVIQTLMDCILNSRKNLVQCHRLLEANHPPTSFVGVIPSVHATALTQGSRDGISSAIALLDQLIVVLQSHLHRKSVSGSNTAPKNTSEDPWFLVSQRQAATNLMGRSVPRNLEDLDPSDYIVGDQLDRFSLTTGMGSLLPDACGCPQFSAHKPIPYAGSSPANDHGLLA
ncbi:hypothetical protein BDW62DRAFT_220328 [Aspergillus aurantiobrunneus]